NMDHGKAWGILSFK
ncbi:hypothetical protein NL108_016084, partial [Boleophthalmus pectinirostris]